MAKENQLYAAALPFIEIRGNQVAFGGNPEALWGEPSKRPIESCEFVIDRRYWELLGRPDKMIVGMSTEAGWEKWVGPEPIAGLVWVEATHGA